MLPTCPKKSALKSMFWLCLQGCDLRGDEWVTASCLSLSETLTTLRTGTELSISKRNRHFWTNMDRNDRHEITSHGRLEKKYVWLLIQWGTRTCGVQLGKNAKITVTKAHLRQCWGLKLEEFQQDLQFCIRIPLSGQCIQAWSMQLASRWLTL